MSWTATIKIPFFSSMGCKTFLQNNQVEFLATQTFLGPWWLVVMVPLRIQIFFILFLFFHHILSFIICSLILSHLFPTFISLSYLTYFYACYHLVIFIICYIIIIIYFYPSLLYHFLYFNHILLLYMSFNFCPCMINSYKFILYVFLHPSSFYKCTICGYTFMFIFQM